MPLSQAYLKAHFGVSEETDRARIAAFETKHGGSEHYVSWGSLILRVSRELVALGVNPAGPDASFRTIANSDRPWYASWEPPNAGIWKQVDSDIARQEQQRQKEHLTVKLCEGASIVRAVISNRSVWDFSSRVKCPSRRGHLTNLSPSSAAVRCPDPRRQLSLPGI